MKKISFIILFVSLFMGLFAQQEPQFTQYMFNKTYINPAVSGLSGALCFSGIGRYQWIGFQDENDNNVSPQTYGFSYDMPLYSIKSGAGLTFQYNKLGAEKNIDLELLYAFHHVFKNNHMFSFGLSFGILNKSIDYSQLETHEYDPSLPGSSVESGTLTDIGIGFHYRAPRKFYMGLSAKNLLGSSAEIGAPDFNLARHFYLYGGYDFEFVTRKKNTLVLTPGFLAKATNGSMQLDINAIVTYNNRVWGGLMYRVGDAVGIMAGIRYRGASLGIAYDFTISSLSRAGSKGSPELFLKYCYPISPQVKKRSAYNTRNL